MDLETITTTAGNHAPLSTAHMAATHPQQHAQVREPSAVRHVHRGYTKLLTLQHRVVRLGGPTENPAMSVDRQGGFLWDSFTTEAPHHHIAVCKSKKQWLKLTALNKGSISF